MRTAKPFGAGLYWGQASLRARTPGDQDQVIEILRVHLRNSGESRCDHADGSRFPASATSLGRLLRRTRPLYVLDVFLSTAAALSFSPLEPNRNPIWGGSAVQNTVGRTTAPGPVSRFRRGRANAGIRICPTHYRPDRRCGKGAEPEAKLHFLSSCSPTGCDVPILVV